MEYELKRQVVETIYKNEFFRVAADSLEEAKRMVDEYEVDPCSEKVYHYEVDDLNAAKEID